MTTGRTEKDRASSSLQPFPTGHVHAMRELHRIVASSAELDVLLKAILDKWIEVLEPAQAATLLLYRAGAERLTVGCAVGYEADALRQLSLRVGESMAGQAFHTGQAALYATPQQVATALADLSPHNRACLQRAMPSFSQPHSAVCVPLICAETKIGILVVENWRGDAQFSSAHLELAQALADLTAVALERGRLAQEVKQARAAVGQTNGLQGYIISALSHEMRTPLATIKGYATALLLDEITWDAQTQAEYLNVIVEESDRLSDIIADLLESSMIDAGLMYIERQPTRLDRLAQEVVEDVSRRPHQHRFLLHFPPDLPIIDADPSRLRRVLLNLVDNAVKYSPNGGLVVIRAEVSGDECVVSVADQGQGIAPEHLNRLFDRFFRVKFAAGQHVAGSGLGLPIARNIVEAHGGRIWAVSKLGEGSTFYFTLPLGGPSREAAAEG